MEISKYTYQILQGLEYLHALGIVHRDIKSTNILVDEQGVCKISDFGSAKTTLEDNMESMKYMTVCGTPYWMAPEVIKQEGHNRKADIWSLGCTVFEMATGRPPWSK